MNKTQIKKQIKICEEYLKENSYCDADDLDWTNLVWKLDDAIDELKMALEESEADDRLVKGAYDNMMRCMYYLELNRSNAKEAK